MRLLLVSLGLLGYVALDGCGIVITEKVVLRHPENRHTVECGPYFKGGMSSPAQIGAEYALAECVRSYERQGYLRAGRELPDSGPTEPSIDLELALGDWNAFGDSDALFRESFSDVHTEIKPETVASVKALAQQGNVRSQVLLGKAYHLGVALPQNDTEAFYWFRRAAEQGDAEAPEFLAIMYSLGLGTTQDMSKAVEWYQRAANQGNRYAQTTLADRYWHGRGVPKDRRRALELYAQAAEQGIPHAQFMLASDYFVDYSRGRSGPEKGLGWLYKAANQGYGPAQLVLGIYFATGGKSPPEPVDLVEGYKWYVISGAHGAGMAHEFMVGL